jgi:hypothetical protein
VTAYELLILLCKSKCLHPVTGAMIRENQQLVADEPVEVKDCRKITIILEEFVKYTPIQ